ncbi:glycosyltransferase family 2 protein [Flavitalea sp. BT771]|uniref:glycosyltransferase family 2 protein n=1 Tax=Flavitalea sp. BT771 TaxID=3063329 RepID=UPI0026E15749|nr:glycosyltransferase family 2 protein [Flavitalea sp. BT771]MDO6433888.1 glycosyltransferase family 2 protein [Flavitalea sp. BT771]MDV6222207.1 glycosyltransferase family 2 protein [Flavitalea sp. BT771]
MYETLQSAGAAVPVRKAPKHIRYSSHRSHIQKLSIIIPAFNEEATISIILEKINQVELIGNVAKDIIIVDDCSSDDTELVAREYIEENPSVSIRYVRHTVNQGKGAAIHTGIQHAVGDYLLIQDADLEYDPREYNTLLEPIVNGYADVVYGSRFMGGKPHRILFFWHTIGNRCLTFFSNMFSNLNLTDMETGYKAFRTSLIQQIPLREKRFGFEPEVTAKIAQVEGAKIYEVGISYYGRTYKEGKKIGWKDGVRTLWCIIKYSFLSKIPADIKVPEPEVVGAA